MREQAVAVENAMSEVTGMCEQVIPEVWEVKKKDERDEERSKGADAVFADMVDGGGIGSAPMVRKFERLSLIA
jgi:hypothetical protein